jgi:outer membrane protein TolC
MIQCRTDCFRTSGSAHIGKNRSTNWCWGLLLVATTAVSAGTEQTLTLQQAEHLALNADPAIMAGRSRAAALQDQAVADGQLPDPKLGLGVYNLPLDDFSFSSQPTTQFRTKIQQAFPRGETLHYRQMQTEWLGKAEHARTQLTALEIQRDLRLSFLELYYQDQAMRIIEQSRGLFQQLVDTTRAHFATGRVNQQDVLRAQLELSRLDDRLSRIGEQADVQRATLSRWLGGDALRPIDSAFPELMPLPSQGALQRSLLQHPAIVTASARVEAHQQMVKAAREQYKPGWNVGIEYRKRFGDEPDGSDRTDMMAAMLTVDLPLFTEKRQDKRLAASQQNAEAARQMREQKLRELSRTLNADYARWQRLGEQKELYRKRLIREATDNVNASIHAYQSGTTEFTTLMRARILHRHRPV